jgi:hypothetical protein
MSQQWKQCERNVGKLVGGTRYPANQGGRVDVEGPNYVVQVKERKSLSLEQLTQLVEEVEAIGKTKGKQGLVAVKVRRGSGKRSPILIVMSETNWLEYVMKPASDEIRGKQKLFDGFMAEREGC